ncbi:hypothetical protein [Streptomyces griseomycini]|uniref:hypothetical protein n=1 Tax=Streptomyces griseomycini TaxID=66895 RepID=UPI0035CB6C03
MRQRVALAAALAGGPGFLVLDEPAVGLGAEQRGVFRELVAQAGEGRTVLPSVHRTEDVAVLCHRAVVTAGGAARRGHRSTRWRCCCSPPRGPGPRWAASPGGGGGPRLGARRRHGDGPSDGRAASGPGRRGRPAARGRPRAPARTGGPGPVRGAGRREVGGGPRPVGGPAVRGVGGGGGPRGGTAGRSGSGQVSVRYIRSVSCVTNPSRS